MKTLRDDFLEEWDNFLDKTAIGKSFYGAREIRFINSIGDRLAGVEENAKRQEGKRILARIGEAVAKYKQHVLVVSTKYGWPIPGPIVVEQLWGELLKELDSDIKDEEE